MKAKISRTTSTYRISLIPETDEERSVVSDMGADLRSETKLISCSGFGYMEVEVNFSVWSQAGRD